MATLNRPINENVGGYTKASWGLITTVNNFTITGASFTPPAISLQAKFEGPSVKNRGNIEASYELRVGSSTGPIIRTTSFARPVTDPDDWSGMTPSTVYNIGVYNTTTSNTSTSSIFKSSNNTVKTINLYLVQKRTRLRTKIAGNDNSETYYDGTPSPASLGIIGTVTLNTPPTLSTTQVYTGSLTPENSVFYANYSDAKVTITNCSAKYGGEVSSVVFTVGSQSVTGEGNGVLTIPLKESGTLKAKVVITDSRGQLNTYQLNDINVISYDKPRVSIVDVERVNTSMLPEDEGEKALITANFSYSDELVDELDNPLINLKAPEVYYKDNDDLNWQSPSTVTWYTNRDSSTKALSTLVDWDSYHPNSPITLYGYINQNFNVDENYSLMVLPYDDMDNNNSGYEDYGELSPAYYTIDVYAGGHGIAFGAPAESDEFKVAMPAIFTDNITALEYELTAGDMDYVVAQGTSNGWYYRKWKSGYAECWGEFQFTNITVDTPSAGTYYNSTSGFKSQNLPSGLFTSVNYAEVTNAKGTHASGVYPYGVNSLTISAVQIQFRAFASSSDVGCPAFIKVYGAWK